MARKQVWKSFSSGARRKHDMVEFLYADLCVLPFYRVRITVEAESFYTF